MQQLWEYFARFKLRVFILHEISEAWILWDYTLILFKIIHNLTSTDSVQCGYFNTWTIQVNTAENLNEGSSKFITKDNRRRIASFKGPENIQTEAPQFGSWHPKPARRRAVNDTKTEH